MRCNLGLLIDLLSKHIETELFNLSSTEMVIERPLALISLICKQLLLEYLDHIIKWVFEFKTELLTSRVLDGLLGILLGGCTPVCDADSFVLVLELSEAYNGHNLDVNEGYDVFH
jgi:hypothetical protein